MFKKLLIVFLIIVAFIIYLVIVKKSDKKLPVITFKDKVVMFQNGKDISLVGVSAKTKENEDVSVVVEGNYDISKPRVYKLKYVATDKKGNTAKEDFTLYVLQSIDGDIKLDNPAFFTTSKGFEGVRINSITFIDGILVVNKTYELPNTFNPGKLNDVANEAGLKMINDANEEGLNIWIQSGFRSYDRQTTLYNEYSLKSGKNKADTYSARPGHSEHQSGLAFDVNQINYTFNNTPEANWLNENAYKYGFILRYPLNKTNETGYVYESWHFRYVGEELASKLYNNGNWITLEDYFGITSVYNS